MAHRWRFASGALVTVSSLLAVGIALPAQAAVAANASVKPQIQFLNDAAGITFTFTVKNASTASESLGSVQITRPGTQWTIATCPAAPTGWTAVVTPAKCTFNSASGGADNIRPGKAGKFEVKATTAPGWANIAGLSWGVTVDPDDTFNTPNGTTATPSTLGALSTTIYSWQVLSAVVSPSAATIGSTCPVANKSAIEGGSVVIVVCGKNRANAALTPISANSSLSGTLLLYSETGISSGPVSAQSTKSVVLANYSGSTITSNIGNGKNLVSAIGSSGTQTSPKTTLSGYTANGWTKFHYDVLDSGYNPLETSIDASNVGTLHQKWTGWTYSGVDSSPAVAKGAVYVTSGGVLHAFDAAGSTNCSGSPKLCADLWTASGNLGGSPAVDGARCT